MNKESKKIKGIASDEFNVWRAVLESIKLVWYFDKSYLTNQFVWALFRSAQQFAGIYLLAKALDIVVNKIGKTSELFTTDIVYVLGAYLCLTLVRNTWSSNIGILNRKFEREFSIHISEVLSNKRALLDMHMLDDPKITNLSTKAGETFNRLHNYSSTVIGMVVNIFTIVISSIALFVIAWWIVPLVILFNIPEYLIGKKFQHKYYQVFDKNTEKRRWYTKYRSFIAALKSVKEIRINNMSRVFIETSANIQREINNDYHGTDKELRVYRLPNSILVSMYIIGFRIYFLYLMLQQVISIGKFSYYQGLLTDLDQGVTSFIQDFNFLQTNTLYLKDFFKFMNLLNELKEGHISLANNINVITFDNVNFIYPYQEKIVTEQMSVNINSGEKIAIVGENGAGKSTFTKLLLRIYDPTSGSIKINGEKLSDISRSSWYDKISYMPQDYNKYTFTFKDSVTFSSPLKIDESRYEEALRISGADSVRDVLRLKDSTILSPDFEGGVDLSVGQWQRIAIARTIYKDAELYIFDEPTSAVDAISEIDIFERIESELKGKTVILISHRFNTVKNADRIFVIEHGRLIEQGSHTELMSNSGRYCEMYTAQKDSY